MGTGYQAQHRLIPKTDVCFISVGEPDFGFF